MLNSLGFLGKRPSGPSVLARACPDAIILNNSGKDSKVAAQLLWLPQQRAAPKHRDWKQHSGAGVLCKRCVHSGAPAVVFLRWLPASLPMRCPGFVTASCGQFFGLRRTRAPKPGCESLSPTPTRG